MRIPLSELIGKPLIALATAELVGTISNVWFDPKLCTVQCVELYCEDEAEPQQQFAAFRKLLHYDGDACVVANRDAVSYSWNSPTRGVPSPLNSVCFNQNGTRLGLVRDCMLDGAKATSILIDDKSFSPQLVLSYSKPMLILNDTGKPYKLVRKKTAVPKSASGISVQIHTAPVAAQLDPQAQAATANRVSARMLPTFIPSIPEHPQQPPQSEPAPDTDSQQEVAPDTATLSPERDAPPPLDSREPTDTVPESSKVSRPKRVPPQSTQVSRTPQSPEASDIAPYAFLLGKTVSRTLTSDEGEPIIDENASVTAQTIRSAKQHGKLVQLALYAD